MCGFYVYVMYSKAVLPIEMELNATPENDVGDDDDESSVVQTCGQNEFI